MNTINLEWQHNQRRQRKFLDIKRPVTIGRSPDSDVVLENSPHVSRSHASIFLENNRLRLLNLSQKNPVDVQSGNGQQWRLLHNQEIELSEGVTFRIGPANFHLVEIIDDTNPGEPLIECPNCQRHWPASHRDCPRCGYSLAGGVTVREV